MFRRCPICARAWSCNIPLKLYTRINGMPDAIWIDKDNELPPLAQTLESQAWIGVDTEFLRERTFFPKLCLLQIAAGGKIWCIDTLRIGSLDPLMPVLTSSSARKVIHAARQDLEAVYLTTRRVMTPVCNPQPAPACLGWKPQAGYAELVKTLLDVSIPKGQTRTDWSKRPLSREQLEYAADDVLYLGDISAHLESRLSDLKREHWVAEDCLALEDQRLYEPDPAQAWARLRGLAQLPPAARARAKAIAVWREKLARTRDLPRAWILADPAIFSIAQGSAPPPHDGPGAQPGRAPDPRTEGGDRAPGQNRRRARRGTRHQRRDTRAARRDQGACHGEAGFTRTDRLAAGGNRVAAARGYRLNQAIA